MANSNTEHPAPSLTKATGSVSGLTLISRILGLFRDMLIARYFGAGVATDAFVLAFRIPNLLRRLVAEGSMATAFVPVFSEQLRKGKTAARDAIAESMSFSLMLTVSFTALGIYFAEPLVHLFAPGFVEPETISLARDLLIVMFPYIILVSLLALVAGALNSLGTFAIPAAAPAILNVAMIASMLLIYDRLEQPIFCLAYAVLLGGLLALIPQFYALGKKGYLSGLKLPFRSRAVAALVRLMLPAVVSASVYQIMVLVNSVLASLLGTGSITWLYYADRIVQFPLGVFSLAVATAVLPSFSKLAAANNKAELNSLLTTALGWINYITIPAAIGLAILAQPIVSVIYEDRAFSAFDSTQTSAALVGYSFGLWALSAHSIIVRAFLAKKNSLLPAVVSVTTICLNVLLALALMGAPRVDLISSYAKSIASLQSILAFTDMSHVGLALAGSLASYFGVFALICLLSKVDLELKLSSFISSLLRCILAASAMGLIVHWLSSRLESALLQIVVLIPIGAVIYFLTTFLLNAPEARVVLQRLKRDAK